eukprot:Awhi_evm2s1700
MLTEIDFLEMIQLLNLPPTNKVNWTTSMSKNYSDIIDILTSDVTLYFPQFGEQAKPFVITTDSCIPAVGAILYQDQYDESSGEFKTRIIAYASKNLFERSI